MFSLTSIDASSIKNRILLAACVRTSAFAVTGLVARINNLPLLQQDVVHLEAIHLLVALVDAARESILSYASTITSLIVQVRHCYRLIDDL
jgi:hypothetical protein